MKTCLQEPPGDVDHPANHPRQRISPLAIKQLVSGIADDSTIIGAFSIQKIQARTDGMVNVTARRRFAVAVETFKVGMVINGTGPPDDINSTGNTPVSFLATNGILRQDDVKTGFRIDPDYTVNPGYPVYTR